MKIHICDEDEILEIEEEATITTTGQAIKFVYKTCKSILWQQAAV